MGFRTSTDGRTNWQTYWINISGTRDLWTPVVTPLQPPRTLYLVAIIRNYPKITLVGPTLRHLYPPHIKTILWFSTVVPTDVVRVSEPAACTLRLSVRVFTPLPNGNEKTQNPGSDILNLGSQKFFYITASSFGSWGGGGGGEGFYIRLWCDGRGMRSDRHSFPSDGCDALWRSGPGLYTWPVWKPWWSPAASPASPSPTPKTPVTDRQD
jgi:hypothetical protein